uniref:Condensation domain-containing protein n=1 Tax=Chromera velia CCMP2878 TaxID=1169474 RepID=A0A0G4FI25_9ALVE|mmetsp:Transcript_36291/g.71400  ORF Transcript_36291/g.71400 Transcript_36291/m.71400 type:complete len:797 (-) Transcript_36291:1525-3915(-)|eukprot:Cvel_17058.t1-p1 / transcript=Cvel_17058.t1 / gene=Cvel_17058 / organism=Chromera_velia_CCMP2878 / gene_product=hypothetical protein / transcript_product=hypothetical protein / location=Cvel_scaffold1344:5695-10198(+) / protein_length=796 / sequence_SO=supercontig / SO=protein_coding / is_pseudo=false
MPPTNRPPPRRSSIPTKEDVQVRKLDQYELFFDCAQEAGNLLILNPVTLRVNQPLDVADLQTASLAMAKRHQALRVRILNIQEKEGGRYKRYFYETQEEDIRVDVRESVHHQWDPAASEEQLEGFDVARGPLFRLVLCQPSFTGADEKLPFRQSILGLFHHSIMDGISMQEFWSEFIPLMQKSSVLRSSRTSAPAGKQKEKDGDASSSVASALATSPQISLPAPPPSPQAHPSSSVFSPTVGVSAGQGTHLQVPPFSPSVNTSIVDLLSETGTHKGGRPRTEKEVVALLADGRPSTRLPAPMISYIPDSLTLRAIRPLTHLTSTAGGLYSIVRNYVFPNPFSKHFPDDTSGEALPSSSSEGSQPGGSIAGDRGETASLPDGVSRESVMSSVEDGETSIVPMHFDKNLTLALVKACKAKGVSVNAGITAIAGVAMRQVILEERAKGRGGCFSGSYTENDSAAGGKGKSFGFYSFQCVSSRRWAPFLDGRGAQTQAQAGEGTRMKTLEELTGDTWESLAGVPSERVTSEAEMKASPALKSEPESLSTAACSNETVPHQAARGGAGMADSSSASASTSTALVKYDHTKDTRPAGLGCYVVLSPFPVVVSGSGESEVDRVWTSAGKVKKDTAVLAKKDPIPGTWQWQAVSTYLSRVFQYHGLEGFARVASVRPRMSCFMVSNTLQWNPNRAFADEMSTFLSTKETTGVPEELQCEVESTFFGTTNHRVGNSLFVHNLMTVEGSLCWGLEYHTNTTSHAIARRYAKRIEKTLRAVARGDDRLAEKTPARRTSDPTPRRASR